jgi:hypothetical protein
VNFDDEVDALKRSLLAERGVDPEREAHVTALAGLLARLEAQISSKRLEFRLDAEEPDEEPSILVLHAETGEELGAVFVEAAGFSFESEDDDYFPDLAAEADPAAFVRHLYDALKVGLPAYELDIETDD